MATLDDWTEQVCTGLGLDLATLDRTLVLDIARDVAHGVARPAAPLTAYLVGVAVGRGMPPDDVAQTINSLIAGWPKPEGDPRDDRDGRRRDRGDGERGDPGAREGEGRRDDRGGDRGGDSG